MQQEVIREVRSICADVLAAPLADHDVIFTANTTEAINLVAASLRNEAEPGSASVILNTLLEHNSNELPWRTIPGVSLIRLPVDDEGFLDLNELEALFRACNQEGLHGDQRIKLVAVSGASNVLGTFNDLAEISRIVHRYGARLLVDAAQLVAHRKVEMAGCGIDYLAFSAHKVYAPFGTGVLLARKTLLRSSSAELELIRSSGEENAVGIAAGQGAPAPAADRAGRDPGGRTGFDRAWRWLAWRKCRASSSMGSRTRTRPALRRKVVSLPLTWETSCPAGWARALAEHGGIGVRYGCHCAHLLIKRLVSISPDWSDCKA